MPKGVFYDLNKMSIVTENGITKLTVEGNHAPYKSFIFTATIIDGKFRTIDKLPEWDKIGDSDD